MRIRSLVVLTGIVSLGVIGALTPTVASAELLERRETTTTSTYGGTVTEIAPSSSTIVVKREPEIVRYRFNEKTTFVDPSGKIVSYEAVRNQPVTVHYIDEGDQMVVTKVEVVKPVEVLRPAEVIEKRTTTTTTHEIR